MTHNEENYMYYPNSEENIDSALFITPKENQNMN